MRPVLFFAPDAPPVLLYPSLQPLPVWPDHPLFRPLLEKILRVSAIPPESIGNARGVG